MKTMDMKRRVSRVTAYLAVGLAMYALSANSAFAWGSWATPGNAGTCHGYGADRSDNQPPARPYIVYDCDGISLAGDNVLHVINKADGVGQNYTRAQAYLVTNDTIELRVNGAPNSDTSASTTTPEQITRHRCSCTRTWIWL